MNFSNILIDTSNILIDTSNILIDISNILIDSSNNYINETYIQIIMNQTDYSYSIAKNKLIKFNNDYMKVIKEYLNIEEKKTSEKSLNQQIYNEIRNFLK